MSPRTPKQFREIREEKRTLIMDTALEHFAREGYHFTTINHIAKHAGISKGLMYNYFESKEVLLAEIIRRSVNEIYRNLDPDSDGILTPDEFEFFVGKFANLLVEKRSIWMLFFQMMFQNDVRDVFLSNFQLNKETVNEETGAKFLSRISKLFSDYFDRKKDLMPGSYDPEKEMNLFLLTMKGFTVTTIYSDGSDKEYFENTVSEIIATFK
jgi:AcrR family transcriptional regulator